MLCENPACMRDGRKTECVKVTPRLDGVDGRLRQCKHCKQYHRTLEWTETMLDKRFESVRREIESAKREMLRRHGWPTVQRIRKVLRECTVEIESLEEELRRVAELPGKKAPVTVAR